MKDINRVTDHLFRENSGKMLAVLCRVFGLQHLDRIQDIVHDTFIEALTRWRFKGIPDNPGAWLMKVAKNKAINAFKRESQVSLYQPSVFATKLDSKMEFEINNRFEQGGEDSQLRLLLLCCNPQLSAKNQVMLTLNVLCGFGVVEIAQGMLLKREAVKKALQRSKNQLKDMKNMLQSPLLKGYEKRLGVVHTILYLIFNEGYKTTRAKEIIDHDLCYEAIRLAKLLLKKEVALQGETRALLAMMFFNLARFPSRISGKGDLITLAEQDRSLWNRFFIEEGFYYLNAATAQNRLSRYHIEAIIASVHCAAPTFEDTDWKTIVFLYRQLEKLIPSPITALNLLVAQSYLEGPDAAFHKLEQLKQHPALQQHYLLYATEGDLLKRVQKNKEAKEAFGKALQCSVSPLEQKFLTKKIQECVHS